MRDFDKRIILKKTTFIEDAIGNTTETYVDTTVWAKLKDVRANDFFSGLANDIKLSQVFVIRTQNYTNQEKVEYEGVLYTVIRTYRTSKDFIELTCAMERGNNG